MASISARAQRIAWTLAQHSILILMIGTAIALGFALLAFSWMVA